MLQVLDVYDFYPVHRAPKLLLSQNKTTEDVRHIRFKLERRMS